MNVQVAIQWLKPEAAATDAGSSHKHHHGHEDKALFAELIVPFVAHELASAFQRPYKLLALLIRGSPVLGSPAP